MLILLRKTIISVCQKMKHLFWDYGNLVIYKVLWWSNAYIAQENRHFCMPKDEKLVLGLRKPCIL